MQPSESGRDFKYSQHNKYSAINLHGPSEVYRPQFAKAKLKGESELAFSKLPRKSEQDHG